jgi:hypothetical protein
MFLPRAQQLIGMHSLAATVRSLRTQLPKDRALSGTLNDG